MKAYLDNNRKSVIARVKEMETSFDTIREMMETGQLFTQQYDVFREKILRLKQYQESGQWLKDFECDERGELPKDLKRGVLSEDGLFNLLSEVETILQKNREG